MKIMKSIFSIATIIFLLFTRQSCLAQMSANYGIFLSPGVGEDNNAQVKSAELSTKVTLEYSEQGDISGTPVIFLHGITDSWHSFEKVMPYLPKTIHAFAITQRGHGNSSKPSSGYHPKDFASDNAAFIGLNNLDPVIIVGHSMGGVVAQQFALDYPQLIKALVVIDSDASFGDNPGMSEFVGEVAKLTDPVSYKFADDFQRATINKPVDSGFYKMAVSESLKVPASIWKAAFAGLIDIDYTSQLKSIGRPTLIFWGEKDSFCFIDDQEVFLNEIKNIRIIKYENTGHALHWEEPQRFAADLVAFVNHVQ
jgi:pimeloyl-ACP methyl ester carboxylesterase